MRAMLPKIADKLHEHTKELQEGGCLTGDNVTPQLRAELSGALKPLLVPVAPPDQPPPRPTHSTDLALAPVLTSV